jgi:DNA modification methylase
MKPYYEDGSVRLFLGDCREVLPTLDIVDHVLTDPPYARDVYQRLRGPNTHDGSGTPSRLGNKRKDILNGRSGKAQGINHQYSSMSIEKLAAGAIGHIDDMLSEVALEIARLTKRWALVFSDAESIHNWRFQLESAGMRYVRTGAWFKPDPMPQFSGDRPAVGFEPCTICHAQGAMRWNGGGSAATWTHGTVKKNRPDHPCPKPLGLMLELVYLFTDPDEMILDPFAGSSTTLVAAKQLRRKAIGIEVDEKFAEVSAKRLEGITKQPSLEFKATQEGLFANAS